MESGIPSNVASAIGGFKMKEGICGKSRRPRGGNLPSDAKLWEEFEFVGDVHIQAKSDPDHRNE
jgi:hypothetical protein